jgi:hypothetical protein
MEVIFPGIQKRQSDFLLPDGSVPHARLFLDGHSTRRLIELWEKAHDLKIDVHIFPSHSSHLIQPLDRAVFGNLKRFVFNFFIFVIIIITFNILLYYYLYFQRALQNFNET